MACVGHWTSDYIIFKKIKNKEQYNGFLVLHLWLSMILWFSYWELSSCKDISKSTPMLLLWMLFVLGLVIEVIVLFLHAKAIASLWIILANAYLRWYGHKSICGRVFIKVVWMRGTLVCNNSLSLSCLHKDEGSVIPQSIFPSFHPPFCCS